MEAQQEEFKMPRGGVAGPCLPPYRSLKVPILISRARSLDSARPLVRFSGQALPPRRGAQLPLPHVRVHGLLPIWAMSESHHGAVHHLVPPLYKCWDNSFAALPLALAALARRLKPLKGCLSG